MVLLLYWLTHVVTNGPVTRRAADVLVAANKAAEVALRLVRPGKKVQFFLKSTLSGFIYGVRMTNVVYLSRKLE